MLYAKDAQRENMKVEIVDFVSGARKAEGIAVVIDVFRAFSVACYCFSKGVSKIYPIGDVDDAYNLVKNIDDGILIGERKGKKLPGFDYGNSPTEIIAANLLGKTVVHTTHAGTQGIVNAVNADEVLTGAFVNAKATAKYIKDRNPDKVTLVKMGLEAKSQSDEDDLCAEYIKMLLNNQPFDETTIVETLRKSPYSERFFDPDKPWCPSSDFDLCLDVNRFSFALRSIRDESGNLNLEKVNVDMG